MQGPSRLAAVTAALLFLMGPALGAQQTEALFLEGESAYRASQFRKAAELFTQYTFLYPQDSRTDDADFLGAASWIQAGDPRKGLESLRRHVRVYPDSPYEPSIPYWMGRAWFLLEKWEEAAQSFQKQSQRSDDAPLASQSLYWWGLSLLRMDRKTEAEKVWREGDIQTLWGQRSRLQAALLVLEQGKAGEAVGLLTRLRQGSPEPEILYGVLYYLVEASFKAGDYPGTVARTEDFFLSFPGDPRELNLRYLRAQALVNQGKEQEALPHFRLCLDSQDRELRTSAAFSLGEILHKIGRWTESLALWTGLPEDGLTPIRKQKRALNAALAAYRLQKWEVARTWYGEAGKGPDKSLAGEALIGASSAAFLGKKPQEARKYLETYLKEYPSAPRREEAAGILLKVALEGDRRDDALGYLDLLVREFPSSGEALNRRLERSRLLTEKKDFASALEDTQFILDRNPASREILGETLYQAAYIYAQRAEPLRGEKYLYRLVEEFPPGELRDRSLLARGLAFYNAGEFDSALASWNRLVRESPESVHLSQVWLHIATLRENTGQPAEAAEAYRKASGLLTGDGRIHALIRAGIQTGRVNLSGALDLWSTLEKETSGQDQLRVQLQKSKTLMDLKRDDEAGRLLDRLLDQPSREAGASGDWEEAARLKTGLLVRGGKDPSGVLQEWKRRYPRSQNRLEALLLHADFLLKEGKRSQARLVAAELLGLDKDNILGETYRIREALSLAEEDPTGARNLISDYFSRHGQTGGAIGSARSLAALLVRKNQEAEIDYWIGELPRIAPPVPVVTEFLLGKGKMILDIRWEEGTSLLEKVLRSSATGAQKVEAVVLLGEGALRTSRFALAKEWVRKVPPGADPVFLARSRLAGAHASLALGEGPGALESLVRDRTLPEDTRAHALYLIWKEGGARKDPKALEAARQLKAQFPGSPWSSLVTD